ncbi:putative aminopeptidase W07G4.4 like protein [Argiope bruennichi]|uniref:Putative aminopeptidase W07G4.4 like protein n=1 Tax=Argiope bruennichi TaxID=94029 RepID=A0A8T0FY60_ARGBR|nr:putative aminopeptidase W07G4.4 like protein [Argiope bruennichi]
MNSLLAKLSKITGCETIAFVDDLLIYFQEKCLDDIFELAQSTLDDILNWARDYKMELNLKKSKVMAIKKKNVDFSSKQLFFDNIQLEMVSFFSDCYVSDEIITSRAGVRVRVGNTDAEGRMAMADVLCHMKEKVLKERSPNPHLFTIATLTGHACLAVGEAYSIIMENGAAARENVGRDLQNAGHAVGDMFEVSTIRREDYDFHKGKSEYEDLYRVIMLPSSRTPRGPPDSSCFPYHGPLAEVVISSGKTIAELLDATTEVVISSEKTLSELLHATAEVVISSGKPLAELLDATAEAVISSGKTLAELLDATAEVVISSGKTIAELLDATTEAVISSGKTLAELLDATAEVVISSGKTLAELLDATAETVISSGKSLAELLDATAEVVISSGKTLAELLDATAETVISSGKTLAELLDATAEVVISSGKTLAELLDATAETVISSGKSLAELLDATTEVVISVSDDDADKKGRNISKLHPTL